MFSTGSRYCPPLQSEIDTAASRDRCKSDVAKAGEEAPSVPTPLRNLRLVQ